MGLIIHHLGLSQSERILFLLEELGVPYQMIKYDRAPTMAPESFKSLPGNRTGQAPFFEDTDAGVTLSESGAICEYLLAKCPPTTGQYPKLSPTFGEPGYVDYIYFFHFANATLQPAMAQVMTFSAIKPAEDNPMLKYVTANMQRNLTILDTHLAQHKWLAGDLFTAADCMTVYSLTTKRYFGPLVSYRDFPNIVRYLRNVGERPAYQRALAKGDSEMQVLLGSEPPEKTLLEVGGIQSDLWKKK